MGKLKYGELSFVLPEHWRDRSQLLFLAPASLGFTHNFTIVRDELSPEEQFPEYIDKQILQLGESLPGFRLLRREVISSSRERVIASWLDFQDRELRQVQYFIRGEQKRQVWIATGTAAEASFEELFPHFEAIAASIELQ